MLYVLPPPSAPSPPSPWVSIRASCNNGNAKNVINKSNSTNSINATRCVVKNSACLKVKMIVKSLDVMKPQHRTCVRKSKEPGAHHGTGGGEVGESGGGEGGGPATDEEDGIARTSRSLSECYFASKGTALVLPPNESQRPASRRVSAAGSSDIQQHLQSMFYLLRPEETLKMVSSSSSVQGHEYF
ncbi:hypothetical protein B566_EDAN003966 [Ephemera danica]|nr:hypothetical protein B566_EDAN003966 [Ephemera danica]